MYARLKSRCVFAAVCLHLWRHNLEIHGRKYKIYNGRKLRTCNLWGIKLTAGGIQDAAGKNGQRELQLSSL